MKVLQQFETNMRNEVPKLMENTIKENLKITKRMLDFIYGEDISVDKFEEIDYVVVLRFLDELGVADRTYNKYVDKIKKLFNSLDMSDKIYYVNKQMKVKCRFEKKQILKEESGKIFKTLDEYALFWEHIVTYYNNKKKKNLYIPIFDLLLNCGLRVNEVNELKYEDVDFNNNKLRIVHDTNRTKKSRTIVVSQECIEEINQYVEIRGCHNGKLFDVKKRAIQATVKRRLEEYGRDDMSCHKFRNSLITHLHEIHPDLSDAQGAKYMGHSVKMFQEVYTGVSDDAQTKIASTRIACRKAS